MADDLLRKDLIAHKIYSAWQFIEYTEKNISTVQYCADTLNNIIGKMTMKTIRWQQDIAADFVDCVTEDGKKVKKLAITTENPTYMGNSSAGLVELDGVLPYTLYRLV